VIDFMKWMDLAAARMQRWIKGATSWEWVKAVVVLVIAAVYLAFLLSLIGVI
jgi:hypothetical protein